MRPIFFITGTDTGVGKTLFARLWVQSLYQQGIAVAAFKPICSGGRDDARALHAALNGTLPLDIINPWYFRAPIAPVLAARRERKTVRLADVLTHIRSQQKPFAITLVEGAGGLLSPLGQNFDSLDLLTALRATPIIVAQNKLGAVNHILLTLAALPKNLRAAAKIILMTPSEPDAATVSNAGLLGEFINPSQLLAFPWFGGKFNPTHALKHPEVKKAFNQLGH